MDFFSRPISPNEDDFWGEPIDVYSDADAIGDGTLVELYMPAMFQGLPINRMTANLFHELERHVETLVKLLGRDFSTVLSSILRMRCQFAKGDLGNTGKIGDIYMPPPKIWLVRRQDGWTAMLSEDY